MSTEKAVVRIDAGLDPMDDLRLTVEIRDRELLGHDARLDVILETQVKFNRPVDKKKVLHTERFEARHVQQFTIPRDEVLAFTYDGSKLALELHTKLVIDDSLLFDTKIRQQHELDLWTKKSGSQSAESIIEPKDDFVFMRNLEALGSGDKAGAYLIMGIGGLFALAIVGTILIEYLFPGGTGLPIDLELGALGVLITSVIVCGLTGLIVWFAMHGRLRRYMSFALKERAGPIRRGTVLRLDELIEGTARVDLERVRLRVVAANIERGQYVTSSGTDTTTVSFEKPVRGVVLYEKDVMRVPAGAPITQYFDGTVDFEPMFATLYPPLEVTSTHGLAVHWEVQLLHPEFIDQELVGSSEQFLTEDFLH